MIVRLVQIDERENRLTCVSKSTVSILMVKLVRTVLEATLPVADSV